MAPWWWFPCKPKHVGAASLILKCFNNSTFFNVVWISWEIKCWITYFCYAIHPVFVLHPFLMTFCFNTPCQSAPLLNLHSLIFCLTPSECLCSMTLTTYFLWEYHFWFMPFLFTPIFLGMQLRHKRRAGRILFIHYFYLS